MSKAHLRLQPSESAVTAAASRIYAAYITSGRVPEGSEQEWIARSVHEAVEIATAADAAVISDDEIESREGQSLGDPVGRTPPSSRHR
jgi:hypothetical protein